jgi:hypothetical protein
MDLVEPPTVNQFDGKSIGHVVFASPGSAGIMSMDFDVSLSHPGFYRGFGWHPPDTFSTPLATGAYPVVTTTKPWSW